MTDEEKVALLVEIRREANNPWRKYENDPVAFVRDGLKETLWSKQIEIMESVRDNKRTAVVACHAIGKSHIAARVEAWWGSVHPAGTVYVVTTAPTYRQVAGILWAQLRRIAARHPIPGTVLTTEWKIGDEKVAVGFSPRDNDESAMQGIHAAHLLVIVDEAGGIPKILGRALAALMTGGHTRLLAIGNAPTDEEDSWFENICSSDLYNTISVPWTSTPNYTKEDAGVCHSCPPEVGEHGVATHLVDETWVKEVIEEFGEDSAFVKARVHAQFPKQSKNKAIPFSWAEYATENENPIPGNVVRLGVDIASDGGDEMVIARADGHVGKIIHASSGAENASAVDVAGKIWRHILEAVDDNTARGHGLVDVKVDAIGVGWGVVSLLQAWTKEQGVRCRIVAVNVAERAGEPVKFANQRAEMWWNMRRLLQPREVQTGETEDGIPIIDRQQDVRLEFGSSRKELAQLSAPMYKTSSNGAIAIEKKADMKRRGATSPDRAEALLLAFYQPPGSKPVTAAGLVMVPQVNAWQV